MGVDGMKCVSEKQLIIEQQIVYVGPINGATQ